MCQTCEVRERFGDLWAVNREAWGLWGSIGNRTVRDLGLGAWVVEQATAHRSPDDKLDLIKRLSLIRDVIDPDDGHTQPQH